MQLKNRFIASALISTLLLLFVPLLKSENRQDTKSQELQHDVTVTLKLIQVYVTDSSGKPVMDLKPEDFRVYDNNKLKKITDFEKYVLSPVETGAAPEPTEKDTDSPGLTKEIMNRKFFLFFDMVNNNYKGFKKAQEAALHFLDNQVQPEDEVGVISYSVLKQMTLHEYLTKDHQVIRDVIGQRQGGQHKKSGQKNIENESG